MIRGAVKAVKPLVNYQSTQGLVSNQSSLCKAKAHQIFQQSVRGVADAQAEKKKVHWAVVAGQAVKGWAFKTFTKENIKPVLYELRPPTPMELPAALRQGSQLFRADWRQVTVKKAWLNFLVTTEVCLWFFVGECLGKGTTIGYQV